MRSRRFNSLGREEAIGQRFGASAIIANASRGLAVAGFVAFGPRAAGGVIGFDETALGQPPGG